MKKIGMFSALLFVASLTHANELVCHDEVDPQAYRLCMDQHHETLSQQLIEHGLREQIHLARLKPVFPATVTLQETFKNPKQKIYYSVMDVSPKHYQVSFETSPLCHYQNDCMLGSLYVAKDDGEWPKNDLVASPHLLKKTHLRVKLSKGIRGFLEKADAENQPLTPYRTLTWHYDDKRFQLSLKDHSQAHLTELANHLIENGY